MSFAWAALLGVIVVVQPGFAFFVGLYASERHPRDAGQARAMVDLALAAFIAIAIHLLFYFMFVFIHAAFKFSIIKAVVAHTDFLSLSGSQEIFEIIRILPFAAIYVLVSSALGYILGAVVSYYIVSGSLRFLATHKWVYDLLKYQEDDDGGYITVYVLTTIVEGAKTLMYMGYLRELYLRSDGIIANLVLYNCSRYYMVFLDDKPETTDRVPLVQYAAETDWNRFVISCDHIANVFFNQTPPLETGETVAQAVSKLSPSTLSPTS
jgi:hypothetical protein